MSDGLAVLPAEAPYALVRQVAVIESRVAVLERRLVKRRPDTNGRRMTRRDRTPFGWRTDLRDPALLVKNAEEQGVIFNLLELAMAPDASLRELCRRADRRGLRRRNRKPWAGAHGLVRSILKREGAETPAGAAAAVQRRIEQVKRKAEDFQHTRLTDFQAREWARAGR